jgi:alkylation response protein AidB-like acyl-CoA dehydrogenase
MRFRFDPEHEELRQVIRRLLSESAGPAAVISREGKPGACDPTLPARLAEIGVYGLGVPERFGGAGFGLLELGVVFQEAGRAALGAPLLSPVLAADLLLQAAGSATAGAGGPAGGILARVAAGELLAAPAITEGPHGWDAVPATRATAGKSPADWTLDGTKDWVQDGAQAGLFVVSDQVGVAQRCLEMAVTWAKEREQFGQAIGSFQAVKHKLASVRLELEAAESACMYALWAAQESPGQFATAARIAAYTCGEAAVLAAGENIQVHGGIGATWEYPAHVYLRRATAARRLLADPQALLEDLAQVVEDTVFVTTAVPAA